MHVHEKCSISGAMNRQSNISDIRTVNAIFLLKYTENAHIHISGIRTVNAIFLV